MNRRSLIAVAFIAALAIVAGAQAASADVPGPILDAYLRIQTALAADKTDGVSQDATVIAKAAGALGAPGEKLATIANAMAGAADIKAARIVFGDLSDAVISMAGASAGKDVRRAYCPMVKKFWLQKGELIANPYYGSMMLRCGEFK